MDGKERPGTEHLAAQTLLDRGVKVKISAPVFIRWFKKTITLQLRSPYYGTMIRVSAYYLKTGLTAEELEDLTVEQSLIVMAKSGKEISKAVACAVLNGYCKSKLFTKPLAWYLRWHCKPRELFALTTALLIYGGVQDFTNTTRSVRRMKMTEPRMGPKTKES